MATKRRLLGNFWHFPPLCCPEIRAKMAQNAKSFPKSAHEAQKSSAHRFSKFGSILARFYRRFRGSSVRGQYIHSARNVCIGDTHSHRQSRAVVVRLTEWTILPCRYSACLQFSSRAQLQASSCAPLLLSCRSTLARWRRERSFPDISPLGRGLRVSRFVAAVLRFAAIIAVDTCSFSREYT